METNFETIKEEILRRAKDANACREQYTRALKSKTLSELCTVVKDNFPWACRKNVIDSELLMQYREEFASNDIYVNTSVRFGSLLCDNATVEAHGSATVVAYGNANVETYDNATVEAHGSATVVAWDNVYCGSYSIIKCKLNNNAIYRVRSTNTIYYASDDLKFVKQDSAD